jgi:hypothetical protein
MQSGERAVRRFALHYDEMQGRVSAEILYDCVLRILGIALSTPSESMIACTGACLAC